MHKCQKCNGFMYFIILRDIYAIPPAYSNALKCINCGDIVDGVILYNRCKTRRRRKKLERQKKRR